MLPTETFRRDVLWNLASIAVLGISGLALNIIIGRYYSIETFGVFSQVLAVYYVLSQLAVGGFVFSSLYMVAEHAADPDKVAQIVPAALILTALQASVVCVSAYGLTDWIGKFFDSPVVARGLLWTLPGLWCFAINKVLLSSINGLSHMRFYALSNSLRFLLILATLLVLTAFSVDETMLPMCLSAGEIILLPILAIYLFRLHPVLLTRDMIPWMRRHMHFGGRAFFSGLLMDINLKVDVVLLGYYFSDQVVGIYSFAAMLAIEGISQIVVAIQININPILTRLKLEGRMQDVRQLVRRTALTLCPFLMLVAGAVGLLYPYLTRWLLHNDAYTAGRIYFVVLMVGIVIASSYLPFTYVLNQWGHPGWFVIFLFLVAMTNALLNYLLIPWMGAFGSALGTALSYVLTVVYLKMITRRVAGVVI